MGRLAPSVIVLGLILTGCGTSRPSLSEPGLEREVTDPASTVAPDPERSTLRLAVDGWTGDPADAGPADIGSRIVADLLYDGLTRLDADGVVRPALADRWSVSPDRLRWVFVISPEAVDGDGNAINARSVMMSLDRIAARGRADLVASTLGAVAGWTDRMDGRAGGVAGITAPFDDQLAIRLDRPFEPLLEVLASPAFGVAVETADGLTSTGPYRVGEHDGQLVPVDPGASLPVVEIESANSSGAAEMLGEGAVDWAVVPPGAAADEVPGDMIRLPVDISVGLTIRLDDAGARRAVAAAIDSVGLAGAVGLVPAAPTLPSGAVGELPESVRIDVPTGPLAGLGTELAAQLEEMGVTVDVVVSDLDPYASRILGTDVEIHPVVIAGGTWAAAGLADALVPGAPNDLIAIDSEDRASLGSSLLEERDPADRTFLSDVLVQTAVDEGVFVPIGRLEVRIGRGSEVAGLVHTAHGTLDLSALSSALR